MYLPSEYWYAFPSAYLDAALDRLNVVTFPTVSPRDFFFSFVIAIIALTGQQVLPGLVDFCSWWSDPLRLIQPDLPGRKVLLWLERIDKGHFFKPHNVFKVCCRTLTYALDALYPEVDILRSVGK